LAKVCETKSVDGLQIHDVACSSAGLLAVGEDEGLFVEESDDSSLDSHSCANEKEERCVRWRKGTARWRLKDARWTHQS